MAAAFNWAVLIALAAVAWVWLGGGPLPWTPCGLFLALLAGLVLLVCWVSTHGTLTALFEEVKSARGALVAQLRQRHDLIPDVLTAAREAVRVQIDELDRILGAFAYHAGAGVVGPVPDPTQPIEVAVFEAAQAAHRSRPVPLPPVGRLDPAVYVELQRAIRATEENVAAARRFVEAAIGQYNAAVRSLTGAFVAAVHGFRPIPQAVLTAAHDAKPKYFT